MNNETKRLERQLTELDKRIERLRASIAPDPTSEHFVGGRVGGSGNPARLARLNRQRERQLDKHIDTSVELTQLIRDREHVQAQIDAVNARPTRALARDEYARRAEAAVRAAGVGCKVESMFGVVEVVRINPRSATVRTKSGNRERLPWTLVGKVVV